MENESHRESGLSAAEAAAAEERARLIDEATEPAWRTGRRIDDLTAKRIAQALTPGSGALHRFAETGAIADELEGELAIAGDVTPELRETWVAALGEYCAHRLIRSEMPYWNDESMA